MICGKEKARRILSGFLLALLKNIKVVFKHEFKLQKVDKMKI